MASRKPLVLINGIVSQLPSSDVLDAQTAAKDVIQKQNDNASSITVGQAAYIKANGNVDLARANASGTAGVAGLVGDASIAAGSTGSIVTDGVVVSSDWTSVTGGTALTPGAIYFLSEATAGSLTTTAPSAGGQFVVAVGRAISATEMEVGPERPIAL